MKKNAYIVSFKGSIICAVQSTVDISRKMLKNGYSVEESVIEPIPMTEIAVDRGHGWEHAQHYAMHNGKKLLYKYSFFGF